MSHRNRREFLADVGKGMLVASVGPALAFELGLVSSSAAEGADRLTFGDREPLVALMEDTPADKLLPILVDKLKAGIGLDSLVAAYWKSSLARTSDSRNALQSLGRGERMTSSPTFRMKTSFIPAGKRYSSGIVTT